MTIRCTIVIRIGMRKKEVVDKCGDPATTVEEMKELMKTNAHTFAGFLSKDGNQGKENELEAADAPNVVYMDEDNVYLTKGTEIRCIK